MRLDFEEHMLTPSYVFELGKVTEFLQKQTRRCSVFHKRYERQLVPPRTFQKAELNQGDDRT